jgi:hypothetical protein
VKFIHVTDTHLVARQAALVSTPGAARLCCNINPTTRTLPSPSSPATCARDYLLLSGAEGRWLTLRTLPLGNHDTGQFLATFPDHCATGGFIQFG